MEGPPFFIMDSNDMKKIAEYLDICKKHWKEIFALSFVMHFIFDWFVFLAGYLVGKYL